MVHDPFSFADEVSSLCPDHFMASLDVKSLLTSVPLNEVIDISIDDWFCDTNTIHNLDRNRMRKVVTLTSFFIFDKFMYRQIDGQIDGQIYFYVILKNSGCQNSTLMFYLKSSKRYVDDIFLMFLCQ